MMFREFTKDDGMKVWINTDDIVGIEETEEGTLLVLVMCDYLVKETPEEILNVPNQIDYIPINFGAN